MKLLCSDILGVCRWQGLERLVVCWSTCWCKVSLHVDEANSVRFYTSTRPTIAGHGNLAGSREEENSRWAICCTREGPPGEPGLLGAGLAVRLAFVAC